ncbi:MAG: tetratricopeptide repeat protein [Elusimicrobiota bacterium]
MILVWLDRARGEFEKGRLTRSLDYLDRAVAADAECAYAFFLRAMIRVLRREDAAAARDFRRLERMPCRAMFRWREFAMPSTLRFPGLTDALNRFLERRTTFAWGFVLRAFVFRSVSRFPASIADIERAISLSPRSATLHAFLGNGHFAARSESKGLACLLRAARLAPDCGWIHAWLGEGHRRLRSPRKALAALDLAVELDPSYLQSYVWRGALRTSLGRHVEACADFDRALAGDWRRFWHYRAGGRKADPGLAWVLHQRKTARLAAGELSGALDDLNRLHALSTRFAWAPNPAQSQALHREGRGALSRLLARDPSNAWAYAWRGWTSLEAGRFESALPDFDRALELGLEHAWVLSWRGRANQSLDKPAKARRDFDRAIRLDSRYAPAYGWRGGLRRSGRDFIGALRDFDRALRLDPLSAWIRAWRGELRLRQKNYRRAVEDLDRSLEIDAGNPDARRWRGEARYRTGHFAAAAADIEESLRVRPRSHAAWALKSLICGSVGDLRGQRFAVKRAVALAPHAEASS